MNLPRVRFTVRRMMVAVAGVAVTLVAYRLSHSPPALVAADWYLLGQASVNAGKLTEGEERFRNALALDPRLYQAHQAIAVVAFRRGAFSQEYDHMTAAIDSLESSGPLYNRRALALLYKSRAAAAYRLAGGLTAGSAPTGSPPVRLWCGRAVKDLDTARGLTPAGDTEIRYQIGYVAVTVELSWGDAEARAGDDAAASAHYHSARRELDEISSLRPGDSLIENLRTEVERRPSATGIGTAEL